MSVYDLAMNMGCKVQQIENHYSHLVPKQRRHEITKTKRKAQKEAVLTAGGEEEDAFVVEALNRYRSGQLSETALLEIVKRSK